jgi:branched-chain amino acid transport system permease protein
LRRARYQQVALLLAAAVAVQLATQAAGKPYLLTQLTMTAYATLVAMGLSLLMGYAGQISLGHAAFFAMGGYTAAALTTWDLGPRRAEAAVSALAKLHVLVARADPYGADLLTVHPWAAFACALALTTAAAFVVGIPVLKLTGHYLAMATLGVGTILYSVALGTPRLGAADGISGVPPFQLLAGLSVGGGPASRIQNYYLAWGLVAVTMLLLLNVVHSRVGRALRAIHTAEDAASAMGIDAARFKLKTFVLSAALAATAGVFLTHFNGGIGPSEASIMKSVKYVAIVAVGGMGSLWGSLTASAVLNFLSLRGYFGSFDDAVFGGILILVMLFSPEGILQVDLRALLRRLLPKPRAGGEDQ